MKNMSLKISATGRVTLPKELVEQAGGRYVVFQHPVHGLTLCSLDYFQKLEKRLIDYPDDDKGTVRAMKRSVLKSAYELTCEGDIVILSQELFTIYRIVSVIWV